MIKIINKRRIGGLQNATPIDIKEEVGQKTEGTYKGFTPVESTRYKGKINNLYFVEIDGVLCSFFGGAALDRRLAEVQVGDWVSITYKGLMELKTGNRLHSYDVETGEYAEEGEASPTPKPKKTAPQKTTPVNVEETDEGEDDMPF